MLIHLFPSWVGGARGGKGFMATVRQVLISEMVYKEKLFLDKSDIRNALKSGLK